MKLRTDHALTSGQWFAEVQMKKWIVWHGTQGRTAFTPSHGKPGDATSSIEGWNADDKHIGTPYLVDRDGTVFQTFANEAEWIFHLGLADTNGKYDKASIGIEFANELELTSSGGKFYAFDRVDANCEYIGPRLERSWRACDCWAQLDEAQVDAAIELTLQLCLKHGIPKTFYYPSTSYDYPHCFEVAGIICHSNCRTDKTDLILEDWVWAKLQAAGFQLVGNGVPVVAAPPVVPGAAFPLVPPIPVPVPAPLQPAVVALAAAVAPVLGDLSRYSSVFLELVHLYRKSPIKYPNLKAVTLAQWINESRRGKSELALKAKNFAGLKYRGEMAGWAAPVTYTDHAGVTENYCAFSDLGRFILGYWHFLDREVYDGWEDHAGDPAEFMRYVARKGFNPKPDYADRQVLPLLAEAKTLLEELPLEVTGVAPVVLAPIVEKLAALPIIAPLIPAPLIVPAAPGGGVGYAVRFYKGDYRARQEAANADRCVAYIEQHFNSGRSSDGYSLAVTSTNASSKSKEWGRAYAKAIGQEFGCTVGGDDGIAVGGFNGRGNGNLYYTQMPAILLEPLFASDSVQAAIIRSDAGQDRLAKVLVATIRQFFPDGGLVAFSVGHKYKDSSPNDRGVDVVGGGTEADFAELVLKKAEKLLAGPASNRRTPPLDVQEAVAVPMAQARVMQTRDNFLAVRKAPKQSAKVVGKLASGTVVDIYGESDIWRRIDTKGERWISSLYLVPVTQDPVIHQEEIILTADLAFDLPAPGSDDLKAGEQLWGTYYYPQKADEISAGVPLRNSRGDKLGPAVSQEKWCHGAMEGTLLVIRKNGESEVYNYEGKGTGTVTSCAAYFPHLKASVLAGTEKVTWKKARGPFGDGAGNFILVPYRTLAVDKTRIPLGTAIYIPDARGVSVTLPNGSAVPHDGYFFAGDVGGAIQDNHLDFFLGVSSTNPFAAFVKSTASATFTGRRVINADVTRKLKALHTLG